MPKRKHLLHFHTSKKRRITLLDKSAIIAAYIYPLSALPQVVEVLNGHVEGVSALSWLGFAAFSAFFIVYATVHKIKPMFITYLIWLIIDMLIVLGVLTHRIAT